MSGSPTAGGIASIICEDVTKVFRRVGLLALDRVSFAVGPGEFVSLLGPSGCGKSTLLRVIDGLTPLTSGRISVNGMDPSPPGPDRGFVFQADSLLPWMTTEANIALGLRIRGARRGATDATVQRLLTTVGLAGWGRRYPHELSGGMRQRANLARALAVDPAVLLMDEPFGALDAQTRELMQAELLRIWEASHKTVLFVTHGIEEAVVLSDRILLMGRRPGRIRREYRIDLPRPRDPAVRRTSAVAELSRAIWEDLRDDAIAALEQEATQRTA